VLPVHSAADGDPLAGGRIYVARPDHHLLVEDGVLRLDSGPRENGHRPAIDPSMRTAAAQHDGRVIAVVLSGTRDDGTAGAMAVRATGGRVVVQDPDDALFGDMPRSVLTHMAPDAVLPVAEIGAWLVAAAGEQAVHEGETTRMTDPAHPPPGEHAQGTRFTCPDCGGVLFEEKEGSLERFRCSVGHVYSPESLLTEQEIKVEGALWAAVRSLEDRAELLDRLAAHATKRRQERVAARFQEQAHDVRTKAETIRLALGFPVADIDPAA
jgi:two-component system chemotaxis response regulator CheB